MPHILPRCTIACVAAGAVCWLACLPAAHAEQPPSAAETSNSAPSGEDAESSERNATDETNDANAGDDVLETWDRLVKRKRAISERLYQLKSDFDKAEGPDKKAIYREFVSLIDEFQSQIEPELRRLAPKVIESRPDDLDAAPFAMEDAYDGMDYETAARLADLLLKAQRYSPTVFRIAGVAHFAIHDFDNARQILEQAEDKGMLDPFVGRQYLQASRDYLSLWEREKQIRERESRATGEQRLPRAVLHTANGDITVELFEDQAPNTVANFIHLAESGFYDGTAFHRVQPHFGVEGGDPNTRDDDPLNDGQGGPGYRIPSECFREDARHHFAGSLTVAHSGIPDTGGSRFIITYLPVPRYNANPETETGHTVFGRVVEGMDVLRRIEKGDKLERVEVVFKRNHPYEPETWPVPISAPPVPREPSAAP